MLIINSYLYISIESPFNANKIKEGVTLLPNCGAYAPVTLPGLIKYLSSIFSTFI
jgi:hypothetical protein